MTERSRRTRSRCTFIVCASNYRSGERRSRFIPFVALGTSSQRKSSVLRFKSIISRIVILHGVAVVITSIFMSLALSWLLSYATDNIHNKAMQEQAVAVAEHLTARPDGNLELNLPLDLLGIYSQPYGRYSYAVIDDRGRVLFSSLTDHVALFPSDAETGDVEFLQNRRGDATVSGASIRKTV